VADPIATVSPGPGWPCTFATAPENTHGWRRFNDLSRPDLRISLFKLAAKTPRTPRKSRNIKPQINPD
jgi:hypothetical protein